MIDRHRNSLAMRIPALPSVAHDQWHALSIRNVYGGADVLRKHAVDFPFSEWRQSGKTDADALSWLRA
jgi:hypothetical protein